MIFTSPRPSPRSARRGRKGGIGNLRAIILNAGGGGFPLPAKTRRVAALGIAGCPTTLDFTPHQKAVKAIGPLKNKADSLGGWIQFQRISKNLTPGHLARKMGIAAGVVLSWESDFSRPDEPFFSKLMEIFGGAYPFMDENKPIV